MIKNRKKKIKIQHEKRVWRNRPKPLDGFGCVIKEMTILEMNKIYTPRIIRNWKRRSLRNRNEI